MTASRLRFRENVTIVIRSDAGRVLHVERGHNLTTAAGLTITADAVSDAITHFGLGTGSTAVAPSDVALGAEVIREVLSSKTVSAQTLTLKYFLGTTDANGSTLREAGLFTAVSGGTLFARYIIANPIVKTTAITVTFVWVLDVETV